MREKIDYIIFLIKELNDSEPIAKIVVYFLATLALLIIILFIIGIVNNIRRLIDPEFRVRHCPFE